MSDLYTSIIVVVILHVKLAEAISNVINTTTIALQSHLVLLSSVNVVHAIIVSINFFTANIISTNQSIDQPSVARKTNELKLQERKIKAVLTGGGADGRVDLLSRGRRRDERDGLGRPPVDLQLMR